MGTLIAVLSTSPTLTVLATVAVCAPGSCCSSVGVRNIALVERVRAHGPDRSPAGQQLIQGRVPAQRQRGYRLHQETEPQQQRLESRVEQQPVSRVVSGVAGPGRNVRGRIQGRENVVRVLDRRRVVGLVEQRRQLLPQADEADQLDEIRGAEQILRVVRV